MKKHQLFFLTIILCLLALCNVTLADTLEDDITALQEADCFDTQLAVLDKIAAENADKLEVDGWDISLNVYAAPGIYYGLAPEDWEYIMFDVTDSLPEAMLGHKFIALSYPYSPVNQRPFLAGDILARLPAEMRAGSLEEAEYALIVCEKLVPSGYVYSPPASSFHRDYEAYVVDMETMHDITRFWSHRNFAKSSGTKEQLNGDSFTEREIWLNLRPALFGEHRYTQADGTVLLFGINGGNCFLKGFEGELTELDVPASVDGHAAIEIANQSFKHERNLKTVKLPEGLRRVSDEAFMGCSAIESLMLPDTLESIGPRAFKDCSRLACVVVGEGMTGLSPELFAGCRRIACCYFPANLTNGLYEFELSCIDEYTVIYAPEGSYALKWAAEVGCEYSICDDPDEMPDIEYVTEGDFEFLICRGEAALSAYLGSDTDVIVPEMAGDVPVTRVLDDAFTSTEFLQSVTLPRSIRTVHNFAIRAEIADETFHLYVTNPETVFMIFSVQASPYCEKIIIHAPEGSLAECYTINKEDIVFEAWGDVVSP